MFLNVVNIFFNVIMWNLLESSPRDEILIGHSAIALPALLSEVFSSMCPPHDVPSHLLPLPIPLPQRQSLMDKGGKGGVRGGILSPHPVSISDSDSVSVSGSVSTSAEPFGTEPVNTGKILL